MVKEDNKNIEKKEIKIEKEIDNIKKKVSEDKSKEIEKDKKNQKKKEKIIKKEYAEARGKNLSISTKHAIAICRFIKNKEIGIAIKELEQVLIKKLAIPMRGEIPHRKGMERGRYPVNASKVFIRLLKSLVANSSVNGIEEAYVYLAKADKATRPYRRFGSKKFKRSNVLLIAKEIKKENKKTE